jgi:beta-galactosidase
MTAKPHALGLLIRAAAFICLMAAGESSGQDAAVYRPGSAHTFTLGREDFLLDGKPFQIIAGEMHFARIPRAYWRQRLRMARAMGLNTVSTYVFWNYHEPEPGKFDFTTESRDIAEFITIAGEEGLWVIVRPGPYACAEWEFGGYPWWLLKEDSMVVRSTDPRFLAAARAYLKRLGEEVAPLQVTRGGPVIMVQVENEYGSYGDDKKFMGAMRDDIRAAGFDVPLFTADGPSQCRNGYVAGALPAINGDEDPASIRDTVRKWNGGAGPFFSPEFYPGWLDHWGEEHSVAAAKDVAPRFEGLLAGGISVSLYMFHGGTNFGFTSGANYGGHYQPQPTSYDYDAPLDEAGRPTPKYFALRDVVLRHIPAGTTVPEPPPPNPVIAVAPVTLGETAPLFGELPEPVLSDHPLPMERVGEGTGYILYRTTLPPGDGGNLVIDELRDYGVVFLDGRKLGSLDRRYKQRTIGIPANAEPAILDILVENGGRINYGREIVDNRKGITRGVSLDGRALTPWKIYPLPMDDISAYRFGAATVKDLPALHRGAFTLTDTGDTFLDMSRWGKGCVWVNGHNLGRFWSIGPQQTLYCPGAWLRKGRNEIVVLAIEDTGARTVAGLTEPVLDRLGEDPLAPPPPVREKGTFLLDSADVVVRGAFAPGDTEQVYTFTPVRARYFALESLSSQRDDPFASAAELFLLDGEGRKIDRAGWRVVSVGSEELVAEDGRAENAFDDDPGSIWHTEWGKARPSHPHHLIIDTGTAQNVGGFVYLPRRGNSPGKIRDFRLYLRGEPFSKK